MPNADAENQPPSSSSRRRLEPYALDLSARKKLTRTDPLVHHGRHFGRAVHIFCNFHVLLTNGILRTTDPDYNMDDPNIPAQEKRENEVFETLLKTVPGVEDRIARGCSEDELKLVADLKGANGARADDTKTLKGSVLEWLSPRGVPLNPPLARHIKTDRGFHHEVTGSLLCPAGLDWDDQEVKTRLKDGDYAIDGDNWPIFLYRNQRFDPENPWEGLFRSKILLSAFKHIFTCPSSVEKSGNTSRGGNARIHGMTRVTIPSIAYAATQVRFAISSCPAFSRTDKTTDSQRFYNSIIEWLEEPDEAEEVKALLHFWNREIFPEHVDGKRSLAKTSALFKLRERRAALKTLNAAQTMALIRHSA